jgi:hypothetical protein
MLEESCENLSSGAVKLPCCHVIYEELVKEPINAVKKIYQMHNWEFTTEYEKILQQYIDSNRAERAKIKEAKGGSVLHHYSPEEFGLTEQELCEGQFRQYIERFNIPISRN